MASKPKTSKPCYWPQPQWPKTWLLFFGYHQVGRGPERIERDELILMCGFIDSVGPLWGHEQRYESL